MLISLLKKEDYVLGCVCVLFFFPPFFFPFPNLFVFHVELIFVRSPLLLKIGKCISFILCTVLASLFRHYACSPAPCDRERKPLVHAQIQRNCNVSDVTKDGKLLLDHIIPWSMVLCVSWSNDQRCEKKYKPTNSIYQSSLLQNWLSLKFLLHLRAFEMTQWERNLSRFWRNSRLRAVVCWILCHQVAVYPHFANVCVSPNSCITDPLLIYFFSPSGSGRLRSRYRCRFFFVSSLQVFCFAAFVKL